MARRIGEKRACDVHARVGAVLDAWAPDVASQQKAPLLSHGLVVFFGLYTILRRDRRGRVQTCAKEQAHQHADRVLPQRCFEEQHDQRGEGSRCLWMAAQEERDSSVSIARTDHSPASPVTVAF